MQIASGDIQPLISMKERCLYKFHVIVLVLIDFQTFLNKGKGKKTRFLPLPYTCHFFSSHEAIEDFNDIILQ